MTAKMFSVLVTNDAVEDLARWRAEMASTIQQRTGCSVYKAVQATEEDARTLRHALETLVTYAFLPARLWVWMCPHCGNWHGTVHYPGEDECLGLSPNDIVEAWGWPLLQHMLM